jgi:2-phospho-L-lactate guanylyltransferase
VSWTAVIPLKGRSEPKTRLASRLDGEQRRALSRTMFRHVADVLGRCPDVDNILILSDTRPEDWEGRVALDEGRGLNEELRLLAASLGSVPLLVIHGDLPLLSDEDIALLLTEAEHGCAIAPDREGSGTNAIALLHPDAPTFAFGKGSFARHLAAMDGARVVMRPGLGLDIDTPVDLDLALAMGWSAP